MDAIIQFCQPLFQPVVLVFTILNLLSMGLQVNFGKYVQGSQKSKVPWFSLSVGLGCRPGYCLFDYLGSSPG